VIESTSSRRRYDIVIRGRLSRRYEAAFDGVTLHPRQGATILRADLADQSQLYGLLNRLRDSGIELISVNAVPEAGDARGRRANVSRDLPQALARDEAPRSRLRRVGSVAEEVVQEAWVAILKGIDSFQGRSAFGTWMFSILINQAKSHSRRERRTAPFSSLGPADHQPAVSADRFQRDDEAWPGHWATPPRPWQ
jgi:hypothetical protein